MAVGQIVETATDAEVSQVRLAGLSVAMDHMRHQRWGSAADVLAAVPGLSVAEQFQMNICRNLAAMQRHQPGVYQSIMGAGNQQRYTVGTAACGHATIFYRTEDGSQLSMSPGNEPVAALTSIFATIKGHYQAGRAMAMLGIGDGYLLKSCALNAPKLSFGNRQSVYLIEPDPQAILACMTIHDYTGPGGPIEDPRFRWCVGPEYAAEIRACLMDDLFNPPPVFEVSQSPHAKTISIAVGRILDDLFVRYKEMQAAVATYYATVTAGQLAAMFSDDPPRQPRILLVTTRSSTVLQYSTRDTAVGLTEIGWDARVFIEPSPHQVVTGPKLMEILDSFKPDAVFQIDHLRSEWAETYPPQLPFICWVQDHLPNLTKTASGESITPRDFLLCGMPRMYSDRYGYPARQFLQMPKLTRIPERPSTWAADGVDIVYVSSASQIPVDRARQLIEEEGTSEPLRKLLQTCCDRMIDTYQRGGTLATIGSIRLVVKQVEEDTGIAIADEESRQCAAEKLFDRLNNALYRQQALRWAQAVADKHGLRFSIHGPGWEKHPEFSRNACGPIAYGHALEELTRSSRINLILEPTLNISHQRLLDALVAGGFCLIRDYPANGLFQEFLNFLCEHIPDAAVTVDQVRAAASEEQRSTLDNFLNRFHDFTVLGDPATHVRGLLKSRILLNRPSALPDLAEVSFADASQLEERVLSALANPLRCREIAERQRTDVESRFSYADGMRRMVAWIGGLLAEEAR